MANEIEDCREFLALLEKHDGVVWPAVEEIIQRVRVETTAAFTSPNLARELHDVSDHGRDGGIFEGPLCDCPRRADRVLSSRWLAHHDALVRAQAISALEVTRD